ncbi:hypothetical protein [Rhizobium sp. EC-SD404]|uniref:hypothetical protein n=1 Tax=Rhizobium sp. EC-SD404 TaxID=2038389 RepID=UPI001252C72E|nr:hypothetical protein [Rhizobium sp. EC-SD404]VVT06646.1 exported hypothetical protein [Rhizobium sp. EC-SD404]
MKNSVFAVVTAMLAATLSHQSASAEGLLCAPRGTFADNHASYASATRMEADYGNFNDTPRFYQTTGSVGR